jgi:hypothetical protein
LAGPAAALLCNRLRGPRHYGEAAGELLVLQAAGTNRLRSQGVLALMLINSYLVGMVPEML